MAIAVQPPLFSRPESAGRNTTTFVGNMQLPVHRWYRYSAGFSASWAEDTVRNCRGAQSQLVLDPFAGSGTTLLAAQAAGADSLGVESQPLIARIAAAKLQWTADPNALWEASNDIVARVLQAGRQPIDWDSEPLLLRKCYTPDALSGLRSLQRVISTYRSDESVSQLLWLAFVAILRPVSHVGTAQWQYVLPNKRKSTRIDPLTAFQQQSKFMVEDMVTRQMHLTDPRSTRLFADDIRTIDRLPSAEVDLVLTSPPYANNYDYADATRLEMTFLGEVKSWGDLAPIRENLIHSCTQHMSGYNDGQALRSRLLAPIVDEVGPVYEELASVRDQKRGRKAYHSMIVAYFFDMSKAWKKIRAAVRPGGLACFVVGDSAPYGVYVPVEDWLGRLAVSAGFSSYRFEKTRDRNVKWKNRKHRVPLHEGRLWVMG